MLSATQVLGKTVPSGDIVGTSDSQTLTNKTISVDDNTVSGIAASSFVLSNSSGNIDGAAAQKTIPSGTVVGTTDSQTLSSKTLANPTFTVPAGGSGSIPDNTANFGIVTTIASQTLTNKTISGTFNTLSDIGNGSLTNSSITINSTAVSLGGSITVRSFTNADITSSTTVTSWTQNMVFTANGAITVTLPAAPSSGDRIRIVDADYGSAGTNITIGRNAKKINNIADDLLLDINGAAVELVYNTAAGNWQILNVPI